MLVTQQKLSAPLNLATNKVLECVLDHCLHLGSFLDIVNIQVFPKISPSLPTEII